MAIELHAADETAPFFEAAGRGVLMLKRCLETGKAFHYPRDHSPFTGGPTEWFEATGKGTIYSCSVARRADPPYCIAYVTLDEGPIILSNILADDLSSVSIGQRVAAVFPEGPDGRKMPFFVPAG